MMVNNYLRDIDTLYFAKLTILLHKV